MCGITGIISRDAITEKEQGLVTRMNGKLQHRGPNSEGSFTHEHVAIAMRRLSIIDLEGGKQPLFNEDKTVVLIANGEIYNFIELRAELQKKGHSFSTKSDCETIVHSYEEYGDEFIHKLRGMFAFCLYDLKKNRVVLGRDRLGEKPLYLRVTDSMIAFSSEFKSIVELIDPADRNVRLESIDAYFHYQFIPEPYTALEGIIKLKKGTILLVDMSTFKAEEKTYWNMEQDRSSKEVPEVSVRKELDEVEKIIIRSDVPIGVSLSGGIDSSLIAILSQKYSDKKIHAFSVGYPGHPENDERNLAQKLAKDLSMDFHDIEITKEAFVADFDQLIYATDDPVADIAAYGYYRVSQKAQECGVPVLFSGFGGDELFWGYPWVTQSVEYNKLKSGFFRRFKLLWKLLHRYRGEIKRHPLQTLPFLLKRCFDTGYIFFELTPTFYGTYIHRKRIFNDSFLHDTDRSTPFAFSGKIAKNPEIRSCSLIFDLWIASNCIPIGDRLSMAHSIEMRLPLLDYKLVESVINMRRNEPGDYKLGYKHGLIDATRDIMPSDIVERKKRGFTPPTTEWVQEIISSKRDKLISGYLVTHGILRKEYIEEALLNVRRYKDFLYKALVLETWLSHYIPKK